MSITAVLDGISVKLDPTSALPVAALSLVTATSSSGDDVPRAISARRDSELVLPLVVKLQGVGLGETTAQEDLHAQMSVLDRALIAGGKDLVLQSHGSAYPVTFRTYPSDPLSRPLDYLSEFDGTATCAMNVRVEPYGYGPEQNVLAAASSPAPCLLDLAVLGMLGDFRAPLELELQSNGTNKLHAVHAGLLPADCPWDDYLVEAESLTWTGGTAAAGPTTNAHGSASKKNSNTAAASTLLNVTDVPEGTYLVLARAAMENGADTGTITIGANDPASVTGTAWRYASLGEVRLPCSKVRAGGAATLALTMASSSATGGHAVCLDCLALVPRSWGYLGWTNPDADADRLFIDYAGTVYVEDVADYEGVAADGPLLGAPRGKLIIVAEDGAGAVAAEPLTVTVKCVPRYAMWRAPLRLPTSWDEAAGLMGMTIVTPSVDTGFEEPA